MSLGMENKVALITGASRGIGQTTAVVFAKAGAKVVIADVIPGDETLDLIKQAGAEALFIETDVSKPADVEAMVKKIVETHGRLDCAVNNAGVDPGMKNIQDWTEEEWDRIIDINLKGTWLCLKYEIPQMLSQGGGAIVNTSSVNGLIAVPQHGTYCASKHGIIGLTKTAALENAAAGIRVNSICAGLTETPLYKLSLEANPELAGIAEAIIPMKRNATMEEVGNASLWLCSDSASYVTGHSMAVDGGWAQY